MEIESGDPSLIRSIEAHDVVLHVVGIDRRAEAAETHLRSFFIDKVYARGLNSPLESWWINSPLRWRNW